jgi:hypothetical protein
MEPADALKKEKRGFSDGILVLLSGCYDDIDDLDVLDLRSRAVKYL